VGVSTVGGVDQATEWSGGSVIDLGGLPGSSESGAFGINDAGQAVGFSIVGGIEIATEWSNGSVIDLGGLPGLAASEARNINDAGQAVGRSVSVVPEPSTWAMMLFGFAGLAFAGYRRAKAANATLACFW
jgi:probable HAF family extracellular repeat protein